MIFEEVLKTIDECDLNNRPNYKKLVEHIKENEQQFNKTKKEDVNIGDEILKKKNELEILKRKNQQDLKIIGFSNNVYKEFIEKVQSQKQDDNNSIDENSRSTWDQINSDMEKQLKNLEMIQAFLKRKKNDDKKEIKIDESNLIKANEILKHFCE